MDELHSNDSERLLTTEEAATHLGYAVQTVYNKIHDEDHPLPCVRLGRSLRFRRSELERWVNEKDAASSAKAEAEAA